MDTSLNECNTQTGFYIEACVIQRIADYRIVSFRQLFAGLKKTPHPFPPSTIHLKIS